jgi:rhomboid protease GluP
LAKAAKAFNNEDDKTGEEILSAYIERVKSDLLCVSNCLFFLIEIKKDQIAFSLLQTGSVNLAKKNIPYSYLQLAVQLYCDNGEFEMAELYLDYMETHYYDAQHKYINLRAFLYYSAKSGNREVFDQICKTFPEVLEFPVLPLLMDILLKTDQKRHETKLPKSYEFNMTLEGSVKLYPLYSFAGLICLVSLIQLFFSSGGSFIERIAYGQVYPIEYIRFGAMVKALVSRGDWVRLITPIFLHAGLLHLAMNIFGLINIGRLLLRFFDKYTLLFIFAAGAVTGNILSFFFSSSYLSVGASGGVFSILGVLFIHLLWHRREINNIVFKRIIVNFAMILAIQILFGLQNSNIDNFAHAGGFIGGVILTLLTLSIVHTRFQKFYTQGIKFVLIILSIRLLIFWGNVFVEPNMERFSLSDVISEPLLEYVIPEFWEKENDRYFDLLAGSQIIIRAYDDKVDISKQIESIKESYTGVNNYRFHSRAVLQSGWTSLVLNSTDLSSPYSLYYFCRNLENNFTDVYLFLDPDLYEDYLPFFEKFLYSVK